MNNAAVRGPQSKRLEFIRYREGTLVRLKPGILEEALET
jgi:hypothetical protein